MPLFSDMRGRFFALPDEVLEQYRLPDATEGAAADSIASAPSTSPVSPASPATAGTTVIIINAGGTERGGADA